MSRRATAIILSDPEHVTLQTWSRIRTQPQRLVQRAQIVLLAAEGVESQEIAFRLRVSRPTVQLWRERFLALRTSALEKDASRPAVSLRLVTPSGPRSSKPRFNANLPTPPTGARA